MVLRDPPTEGSPYKLSEVQDQLSESRSLHHHQSKVDLELAEDAIDELELG